MLGATRQLTVPRDNVTLYQQQQTIAEKTVHDLGRLRVDKLVSQLQYRDAEVRVLNVRQSVAEARTRIAQLEQEHEQMRHELGRLKAEHDANRASSLSELLGYIQPSNWTPSSNELDALARLNIAIESGRPRVHFLA